MNATPYSIKKMSPGEILDTSILVFRDNLSALLGIAFVVHGTSYGIALSFGLGDLFSLDSSLTGFAFHWPQVLALLAMTALAPLGTLVSTKVIAERYLGRRVRVANAVLNAVKLSPALLLALMASGLLTFFGYMLLIIPGIFVSLKLILVYPALVVERRGGISSMERSWKLTRGSIVKLMILYLVSLYPAFICGGLLFLFLGQGVGMDVAVQVLSGVMTAFLTVMLTVTYFERRCEKEAFDMQLLAQSFED